jgi:hypothetical protein
MAFVDRVRDGDLPAVRAGLDAGAPIDAPDARGRTPLMIACAEGHREVARLLVMRGARLDGEGPRGETALGLAMVHCRGIAELLVERGVLGRPLRTPATGALLSPDECDVCTRYPDRIEPDDRWRGAPVDLAWLEIVDEHRSSEDKTDRVERTLRCPLCGTHYAQSYECEVEIAGVTPPSVTESIRRCHPRDVPTRLLGALFVAEDGKLACRIERGGSGDGDRAPYLTTVWAGIGGRVLLEPAHTTWRRAAAPGSEHARDRLGRLEAELGIVGVGNLYSFYVVRRNPAPASPDDKEWIAALPNTPRAELRLFPQHSTSPYMPDDWDWRDGWWYPYSTVRPATAAEQAAHDARQDAPAT